jgi:ankyrin repeat protein
MRHLLTDLRGNVITARRPNKRVRHPHLPQLFYLVQNRSWDAVMRRSVTHPHEVTLQEETSLNTPLHIAVRLDPPGEVIKALLSASSLKNAEGSTPLHLACTHRVQSDVIRVLLQQAESSEANENSISTHPTAILTRTGRAPIHYACMSFRGLSVEAFQVLLDATLQHGNLASTTATMDDPEDQDYMLDDAHDKHSSQGPINVMTLRDSTGQTPLGLLFRRYRERVRCVIKSVERLRLQHNTANSNAANIAAAIKVQADLGELWAKARIIVGRLTEERLQREGHNMQQELESPGEAAVAHEAAKFAAEQYRRSLQHAHDDNYHNTTTVHSRQFRIVHASVGLTGYGCPPELIRLAISIHPTQVHEMDEEGNLPLHIAAVASSYVTCSPAAAAASPRSDFAFTPSWQLAPPTATNARPASDEDSLISDISGLWSVTTKSTSTTNAFDKVIKILLNHYPAAARIPHGKSGRLPLLLAIEAKRRTYDDGIRTLLEAFPAALAISRTPLTLFPYILAKVDASRRVVAIEGFPVSSTDNNKKTKRSSSPAKSGLNTLFELIKAKPELVKNNS